MNFKTKDGTELFVRDWPLPSGAKRRGAVLFVHGLGEHSGRYAHVAEALNGIGIAARSYDHRGFGQSGGPRATLPTPNALLDDAKAVFDTFAADTQSVGGAEPPFLIGHSMGGAIVARAVTGGWIRPRGLVLSSPALKLRPAPAALRLLVRVLNVVAPHAARPHGLPLHMISRDPQVIADAKADPHCHDLATPRLAAFIAEAGAKARRDSGKLEVPTLLLVSGTDQLVDPDGSREFAASMAPGFATIKIYPALYHEVFNELPPDRAQVLADLCSWLTEQAERRSS